MNWRDEILALTRFTEIVLRLLNEDTAAEDKAAMQLGLQICHARITELKAHSGRKPRKTKSPTYDMEAFQIALQLALGNISRKNALDLLGAISMSSTGDDSTAKRQLEDMKGAAAKNAEFLRQLQGMAVQKKTLDICTCYARFTMQHCRHDLRGQRTIKPNAPLSNPPKLERRHARRLPCRLVCIPPVP